MAIFHRKLFPHRTSITNETSPPCTDFCDSPCSDDDLDDCFPFPDPNSLPSPPFIPPQSPSFLPPSTAEQGFHLSPLVVVVVITAVCVFLLISYYAIIAKSCSNWNWTRFVTRRHHPDPPPPSDQPSDQSDDLFHDMGDDQDPVIDHPIWLISTVGLQQSVINSISVIRYKREEGLFEGTDCSVCLCEFQEGETLRLLPKCNHAFHIDCIDTWLRSHTNCPLCRAGIVGNPGRPSLASNEPSFGHSRRTELTQMEDSELSDVELGISQTGNSISGVVVGENRDGTEHNEVDNDQIKAENDFNNHHGIGSEGPLLLIRRSFSMDFFLGSNFGNVGSNSSSFRLMGSSSWRPPQVARTGPMKRSYSWSERVLGSTRNLNRNSYLPQ